MKISPKRRNKIIEDIESLLPKRIGGFANKILIYNFLPKNAENRPNAFCYYYSKKHKSTIFIYPIFWKYNPKEQKRIIFHEIAHIYIHFHNLKNNEREANKLTKKWLEYNKNEIKS